MFFTPSKLHTSHNHPIVTHCNIRMSMDDSFFNSMAFYTLRLALYGSQILLLGLKICTTYDAQIQGRCEPHFLTNAVEQKMKRYHWCTLHWLKWGDISEKSSPELIFCRCASHLRSDPTPDLISALI